MRTFPRSGSALLITLAVLVIVTVMVIAFAMTVRLETSTASQSYHGQRARMMAGLAVDETVTKLQSGISTNGMWAVAPGRLVTWTHAAWQTTDLSSGSASNSPTGKVALNAKSKSNGERLILSPNAEFPNPDPMEVAWINVLQDGTLSTDPAYASAVTAANPIVGRYAYWVDPETGRVNLNTAGKAETTYRIASVDPANNPGYTFENLQNLTAHPSRVDLSKLDAGGGAVTPAKSLATYNSAASSIWYGGDGTDNILGPPTTAPTLRPADRGMQQLNAVEEWTRVNGITGAQIEANKFNVTTLGRTPELTPWGNNRFWMQLTAGPQTQLANTNNNDRGNLANGRGQPVYSPAITAANSARVLPDTRYYVYPSMHQGDNSTGGTHLQTGHLQGPSWMSRNQYQTGWFQRYMENMMALLNRRDWPGMPQKSFVDKYGLEECESLAANILALADQLNWGFAVNYLSSMGGANWGYGDMVPKYARPDGSGTVRRFPPLGPWPLINEVAVTFTPTTSGGGASEQVTLKNPDGSPDTTKPSQKVVLGKTKKDGGGPGAPCALYKKTDLRYTAVLQEAPEFKGANSDDHRNILLNIRWEYVYPPNWAHDNFFVGYSGGYKASAIYTSVEVVASGMFDGVPIIYGVEGQAAPQTTWEKPAGATASQYLWGYPDDGADGSSVSGIGWGFGYNGSLPSGANGVAPSSTPYSTTLPSQIVGPFDKDSEVTVEVKFRPVTQRMNIWTQSAPLQIVPYAVDLTGQPDDPANPTKLDFKATFMPDGSSGPAPTKSLELIDPRLYRYRSDWHPSTASLGHTLGGVNSVYVNNFTDPLTGVEGDSSKLAWPNFGAASRARQGTNDPRLAQNAGNIVGFPGIGWLSVLPTNLESGGTWSGGVRTPNGGAIPWRTLSLEPAKKSDQLPDWLLLEIFTIAYEKSYLSQTEGKLNVNARISPFGFDRLTPLKALLIPANANASTDSATIAPKLAAAAGAQSGPGAQLPADLYVYPGQIAQVSEMAGSGSTQWEREALMRDVAGLVTTRSSDFKVHAVAQSLAPNPANPSQPGRVLSEQRLEAIVSRETDVGPDRVPGTADDMAGPDRVVGTSDDLVFKTAAGNTVPKLNYNTKDPDLEGHSGRPPFRWEISQFKWSNP